MSCRTGAVGNMTPRHKGTEPEEFFGKNCVLPAVHGQDATVVSSIYQMASERDLSVEEAMRLSQLRRRWADVTVTRFAPAEVTAQPGEIPDGLVQNFRGAECRKAD